MKYNSGISIKLASADDAKILHSMILESTDGNTDITLESLIEDLFKERTTEHRIVEHDDPSIYFDSGLAISNRPAARAMIAKAYNQPIGYVIYQSYFSPWSGRSVMIVDAFVIRSYKMKGVMRSLINEVNAIAENESSRLLIFKGNSSIDKANMKNGYFTIRGNETDWSVYRMPF